ncbi:MAG TPA: hypothetical protein PLI79_02915 [Mycobacterium sp.]|nr:hypothetical protein [Mycobacterium sp.]
MDVQSESDVLGHGFRFKPAWWTDRVPADWGSFLDQLPPAEGGRGYRSITRADLLAAAAGPDRDTAGLGRALVAGYVWGTGSWGFLVGRRARVFRDNSRERIFDALVTAGGVLAGGDTEAAYALLSRGQEKHLPWLGPSFFTKFLYAADAKGQQPGRALILDRFVAKALNQKHSWGISERGPWSAATYTRWLDHAHALAASAEKRPDAVEMAYFKYGRAL